MTNIKDEEIRQDAVRGPWVAVLTDQYGDPMDVEDFDEDGAEDPEIAVVRRSAAPHRPNDRRPGSYFGEDVLCEWSDFDSREDLLTRWAQAQAVAAGLNAKQETPLGATT